MPNSLTVVSTVPGTPATGMIFFDNNQGQFLVYDGATWTPLSVDLEDSVQKLTFDTGKVCGYDYLTITPRGYDWSDLEAWCTEAFGLRGDMWKTVPNARWYANNAKLWFRDRKDYDWFIIRWNS